MIEVRTVESDDDLRAWVEVKSRVEPDDPMTVEQVERHRTPDQRHFDRTSFHDWRIGDFAVWGSKLRSTDAAIDMLLPLAAVAFGLTGIGIVYLICAATAS